MAPTSRAQTPFESDLEAPPLPSPDTSYGEASFNATLETLEGETVPLDSFKGKVIFSHLWATNCAPCIPELPSLERLYKELPDETVAFLMISRDDSAETVETFMQQRNLDVPVYFLRRGWPFWQVPESGRIMIVMPSTYIIGKEGLVRYKHVGAADWSDAEFKGFIVSLTEETTD
jgi:thiol-disulfide isomerase/thioredoxin